MTPNFEIKGQTYYINDITLKTYGELKNILLAPESGDEFKIAEIVTKCPADILKRIKYVDWIAIWAVIEEKILSLQKETDNIKPVIELNGVRYTLPNIDDMTIGEFADLDVIFSADSPDKLKSICAILYRPEGEEYDVEGYKKRMELFDELPMSAVKSANSFFFYYADNLLKNMMGSLMQMPEMRELKTEDQETIKNLHQKGFGGEFSTLLLEGALLNLTELRGYKSEQHLTGLLGKQMKQEKKTLGQRIKDYSKKIRTK